MRHDMDTVEEIWIAPNPTTGENTKNAPVDVLGARGERGELGLLPRLLLDLRHLFVFFFRGLDKIKRALSIGERLPIHGDCC